MYNNQDIICSDYESGLSIKQIVKKYTSSSQRIRKILINNNYKIRPTISYIKSGPDSPNWRGGKKSTDGYLTLQNGSRLHRIRMEELINRKLRFWEIVHHIDGDKKNNLDENIIIMPIREHSRFHDFLLSHNMEINKENLERLCFCESKLYYRFTTRHVEEISEKYSLLCVRKPPKIIVKCIVINCNNPKYGGGYCNKHWQRIRARKRGFWKSGHGRTSKCLL